MNLKTATLIAIIGQVVTFIWWQCYTQFHLYRMLGASVEPVISLIAGLVGTGSLVLFLVVLYSKQK